MYIYVHVSLTKTLILVFNQADIHILKTSNKYFAWIGKNGQKANQKLYKNSQKY